MSRGRFTIMKKTRAKTKSQSFTCSNPECERVFDNPIIVQDLSSTDKSSYYACPYCLTEIVVEGTSHGEDKKVKRKRKGTKIEETKAEPLKEESVKPSDELFLKEHECPYYFGYLNQRSKGEEIPEECLTCKKIVQCMLTKVAHEVDNS